MYDDIRNQKIRAVYELLGEIRGEEAERKFIQAWRSGRNATSKFYEQFVLSVQRASLYQDYEEKIDAVMYTLLSKSVIPIQIKSSYVGAKKFLDKHLPIPVVCINQNDTSRDIRKRTVFEIVNMFPFLEEEIRIMGCEVPRLQNFYRI